MIDIRNIPKCKHYAIITERRIDIPGDERSKTHPGHGYPAEIITVLEYKPYEVKETWINEIKKLEATKTKYRAVIVDVPEIFVDLVVNIQEK